MLFEHSMVNPTKVGNGSKFVTASLLLYVPSEM